MFPCVREVPDAPDVTAPDRPARGAGCPAVADLIYDLIYGRAVDSSLAPVRRALCAACHRPLAVCVCAHVRPQRTQTRIVILQHPRERHVPINTVRLAQLSLPDAVLRRGVDFAADPVVADLVAGRDGGPPPYLLFPGPNAVDLARERPAGPITLVVLDGTWWQARKLLRRNPAIAALPQLRLAPAAPSRYRIRREPDAHYVATIEAIALALRALEGDAANEGGAPEGGAIGLETADARFASLLAPFDAMVEHQLAFASRVRDARHLRAAIARGPRRARRSQAPALAALRAAAPRLVVVHGEANAWPVRVPDHPPPEIVHWLAWRPDTDETFEAVLRPRGPLAPSATLQVRLEAATLAAGEPWDAFFARWEAFLRPGDVLCAWGHFPTATLAREGAPLPETQLDARVAASGLLGARVGTTEDCARRLEALGQLEAVAVVETESSGARGRGGARMATLRRVVAALLRAPGEAPDEAPDGAPDEAPDEG
jgi:DTW domain-containing protein YfiP